MCSWSNKYVWLLPRGDLHYQFPLYQFNAFCCLAQMKGGFPVQGVSMLVRQDGGTTRRTTSTAFWKGSLFVAYQVDMDIYVLIIKIRCLFSVEIYVSYIQCWWTKERLSLPRVDCLWHLTLPRVELTLNESAVVSDYNYEIQLIGNQKAYCVSSPISYRKT